MGRDEDAALYGSPVAQYCDMVASRKTEEVGMGRPSIQGRAMTAAERQRRHREKLRPKDDAEPAPGKTGVDLLTMTNLFPRRTGLPMTVWVSPRGRARHAARIKVNTTHGPRAVIDDSAVVAIRPEPRLVAGQLSPADLAAVSRWIRLNEVALIDHWNGIIDGGDLIERLRSLPQN
jgi:hypothetical protein